MKMTHKKNSAVSHVITDGSLLPASFSLSVGDGMVIGAEINKYRSSSNNFLTVAFLSGNEGDARSDSVTNYLTMESPGLL